MNLIVFVLKNGEPLQLLDGGIQSLYGDVVENMFAIIGAILFLVIAIIVGGNYGQKV